jgi:YVTN family beta-propeller protein
MTPISHSTMLRAGLLAATMLAGAPAFAGNNAVDGNNGTVPTPPGLYVTPLAVPGATQLPLNPGLAQYPNFVAGEAVKAVTSPDGTTLAVLTAGHNQLYTQVNVSSTVVDPANSTQYVFIYDVSGANKNTPLLKQVIKQNNTYVGLAWNGNNTLYAAGGNDDAVYVYTRQGGSFVPGKTIGLNHYAVTPTSLAGSNSPSNPASYRPNAGLGLRVEPNAAGLAVSADGATLVVANNYNDSISVVDTATGTVRYEWDLRPYNPRNEGTSGAKGGTYPLSVAMVGNVAYVGCDRDREVVVIDTTGTGTFRKRIPLNGNPQGMAVSADGTTLYVAQDNADQVAVINTATNTITTNIDTRGPASLNLPAKTTSASPAAVTINGNTLYAVNAGSNSVAVIPLTGANALTTTALIPTAYDPTDIAFSGDGTEMYVVNGKSDQGPNPGYGYGFNGNTSRLFTVTYPDAGTPGVPPTPYPHQTEPQAVSNTAATARLAATNNYQFQLEHATLVSATVPTDAATLSTLTAKVAANNGYNVTPPSSDAATMNFLAGQIKHVIYIVKENRTFDQILGDLNNGSNGQSALTLFGRRITPNFHKMALNFVTLDNFMDPGDGSMDGWSWSMRGRVTNTETVTQQENYANVNRGLSYEGEGQNRNTPVDLPTVPARDYFFDATGATQPYTAATAPLPGGTANFLVANGDHAATDSSLGYQAGYIYNAVLNAGGTVRNYGWMANTPGAIKDAQGNPIIDPFAAGVEQTTMAKNIFYGNKVPPGAANASYDPYFRAYDQNYPDLWRTNEFIRDVTANGLQTFSLIRGISHDHTGSFGTALANINAPELQQADNDYAVGKLVQFIANSPQYKTNTLIFVIEDDCQDGADHVDSHRSTTYVVGPYVRQHAIVSTRYSQVNLLRTIEDIIGGGLHINMNTAYARPMADVFDTTMNPNNWSFTAQPSSYLSLTSLMLAENGNGKVQYADDEHPRITHDAAYWAEKTRGFDFSGEDRVPPDLYNQILWEGLKPGVPAPKPHTAFRSGTDLSSAN